MLSRISAAVIIFTTAAMCQAAPVIGDKAPEFDGLTDSGAIISLADYQDEVVVLDFFAPWCSSCRQASSFLAGFEGKYKAKIIGMNVVESGEEQTRAYIREKSIRYPLVYARETIQDLYGVSSIPLFYVIARDGSVAAKFQGFNSEIAASLTQIIIKLNEHID